MDAGGTFVAVPGEGRYELYRIAGTVLFKVEAESAHRRHDRHVATSHETLAQRLGRSRSPLTGHVR